MEPSDMIEKCILYLKKCLEEDEIILLAEEIQIAIVSKNIPFSFLDDDVIYSAVEKNDYSVVTKFFNLQVKSSST